MIYTNFHITITCLWLSLQIILGSVGLPIIEHYCQVSGESNTSVFIKTKDCCCIISNQKLITTNTEVKTEQHHSLAITAFESSEEECCDTQTTFEKANFEAISLEKSSFKLNYFSVFLPSVPHSFNIRSVKSFFDRFQILHFADLPPPNWKLGKRFIVFIQVFRW